MADFERYLDAELDKFMSRQAQFGGRGGYPQSWAPGASSIGRGTPNVGRGGQNDFSVSMGLDTIMGRTRRNTPDQDVPDINMERWLEGSHTDVEKDRRGYDFNQEERQALELREKVRRREQYLAQSMVPTTKVEVRRKFKDGSSPEQHRTIEETLEGRHENDGKIYSDQDVPQIQPERTHGYAGVNYRQMLRLAQQSIFDQNSDRPSYKRTHTSTEANPIIQADEVKNPMGEEAVFKKMPVTGHMSVTMNPGGIPTSESDFEHALGEMHLDDAGKEDLDMQSKDGIWGELGEGGKTLAFGYPGSDDIGDHSVGSLPLTQDVFNEKLNDFLTDKPDTNVKGDTIEEQLSNTRPKRKFRPQDLMQVPGWSETDAKHLTNPNFPNVPAGMSDYYDGGAFADHGVPLPKI